MVAVAIGPLTRGMVAEPAAEKPYWLAQRMRAIQSISSGLKMRGG